MMTTLSIIAISIIAFCLIGIGILLLLIVHWQNIQKQLNDLYPLIMDVNIPLEEILKHKMPRKLRKKLEELLNETTEHH